MLCVCSTPGALRGFPSFQIAAGPRRTVTTQLLRLVICLSWLVKLHCCKGSMKVAVIQGKFAAPCTDSDRLWGVQRGGPLVSRILSGSHPGVSFKFVYCMYRKTSFLKKRSVRPVSSAW